MSFQNPAFEYFAKQDANELISHLSNHILLWGTNTSASSVYTGIIAAYWRNMAAYYSPLMNPDSWMSSLGYVGEQGELVRMVVPIARTLIQQYVSLVTRQRLNFECITDVTDSNPLMTVRLGKAICNAVSEKNRLDEKAQRLAERVAVFGMGFISCTWETDKGYIYSKNDDESYNYSGEPHIETHDMMDVVFDWSVEDWGNLDWVVVKRVKNRWNLISQHPELKSEIISLPSVKETRQTLPNYNFLARYDNSDMIYVYEFYHKPTPALPHGRMTIYGGPNCVFFDSPDVNPYECLPVFCIKFEQIAGTGLGFPLLSSMLPAQEMFDHSMSVIATNQQAFGVQSVLVPKGADISVNDLQGMNFITYTAANAEGGGKPEPLQLTATPPEVNAFADRLRDLMGEISMINSTLRGSPPSNVTSGAMAATLSANALEFLSNASKAMTINMEALMNLAIKCYKKFANVDQIVDIVGDNLTSYVKEFKADTLKSINRIKVREQNPLLSSVAGRLQLTDSLMQSGLIKDPSKYFGILEGAPVQSLYEDSYDEQIVVQQEIDAIMDGRNVMPIITDNHPLFIKGYKKILANPIVRVNSTIVQTVIQLMTERIKMMDIVSQDPVLSRAIAMQYDQPPPGASGGPQGGPPPGDAVSKMEADTASPADPAKPSA